MTPSCSSCSMPRRNCLKRLGSLERATWKCSGANSGMAGNSTGSSRNRLSPTRSEEAFTRPTTSPGKASSMTSRSRPNTCWAYLVAKDFPVRLWVTTMPRSKMPEQTRMKATWSRWALFMPAWTLKTNPANGASTGRGAPSTSGRGRGGRGEVHQGVEDFLHAEVQGGGAEQDRGGLAGVEGVDVELEVGFDDQPGLVHGVGPVVALAGGGLLRGEVLGEGDVGAGVVALELRRSGHCAGPTRRGSRRRCPRPRSAAWAAARCAR